MSSTFSNGRWTCGMDCGFKIGKFSDQPQKSTGLKYAAHLLTQLGHNDLPFSGLNFLNGFENNAQAVTGDMTKGRKIKNKPGGTFRYRIVEQLVQLVGRHFIDVASDSDNKHLTTGFSMYRHFFKIFIEI
jgi:hypothetical protein